MTTTKTKSRFDFSKHTDDKEIKRLLDKEDIVIDDIFFDEEEIIEFELRGNYDTQRSQDY